MDTSKIIKGVVSNGRYTVTTPIVKEDYGLQLQIEGVDLPSSYQVDFSNSENSGTSITMVGNSNKVRIPTELIETGKDIFAFLYVVGSGYGRTVYKFRIPNKARPDRTNEQPTPEEQSTIDQLISALNSAVEQTTQDVIDADASAQSASQSAENAHDSAVDAQNYAESASGYASDAQGYATTASQKATEAGNSADQAAQIKTNIEGYASTAQTAAQTATDKAAQASQSATNASNSATTASTKAGEASASATTASNKASEASGYASTASQKATEASQSASQASGYAQTAEQAKVDSQAAQGLAEQARDDAISAKNDAESAKDDAESARDEAQSIVDEISGALDDKADVITDTASGAIASFTDGANDIPLQSLVVDINPVQDLHGYDSPWVGGGGKNLFDATLMRDQSGWYNIPVKVKPNTVYTMSSNKGTQASTGLALYFNNTNTQGGGPATFVYSGQSVTITSTSEGYVYVSQRRVSGEDSFQNYHYQIEEGSTATAYAPYENLCPISGWTQVNVNHSDADMTNPTTITIDLGQTVYGAKLYPLEGKALIDRAMLIKNTSTMDGGNGDQYPTWKNSGIRAIIGNGKNSSNITALLNVGNKIGANTLAISSGYNDNLILPVGVYGKTQDEWKALAMDIQIVAELAEPIEIQLDVHTINSLYGVNNIWADSGDTEVVYRADTKAYIAKKIAEAISALS